MTKVFVNSHLTVKPAKRLGGMSLQIVCCPKQLGTHRSYKMHVFKQKTFSLIEEE